MNKTDRINILYTIASYFTVDREIGGGEIHLLSLISKLTPKKYNMFVAYPGPGPFEKSLRALPVTRVPLRSLRGKYEPLSILALRSLIGRHQIHIVHAYEPKSAFVSMMAGTLCKTPGKIYTEHLPFFTPYWQERGFRVALHKMRFVRDRLTCLMADRIIAVSDEIRREKVDIQRVTPNKVATILNAADEDKFSPTGQNRSCLHRKFHVPREFVLIGVIARLEPHKGHKFLIQAMSRVIGEVPNARLVVVGEGSYEKELKKTARDCKMENHIMFTGFQKDVASVLAGLFSVVLPSLYESTNLSLIEAMLMEKPVVASAIPSHGAMIEDGVNGFLVPPGNAEALAEAMIKVLTDRPLAARMGRRGRKIALEQFSLHRMAKQTERVYEDVLGSRTQ